MPTTRSRLRSTAEIKVLQAVAGRTGGSQVKTFPVDVRKGMPVSFDDQKCQDELQICDVPDRAGEQSNADTSADMRHSLKSELLKGGYTGDCII